MSERAAVNPPRDLAKPERVLRAALALVDRINPFLAASQPAELEYDEPDRVGQVAGFVASQAAMEAGMNARRRAEWRARYGGTDRCLTPTVSMAFVTMQEVKALQEDPAISQEILVTDTPGITRLAQRKREWR